MAEFKRADDLVKSHLNEAIKQFFVFDGSDRLTEVYTAKADAKVGDPCGKTTYAYVGATTKIQKMKEELAVWQSGWDI